MLEVFPPLGYVCHDVLNAIRQDIDAFPNWIYEYDRWIIEVSGITISMPRVSKMSTTSPKPIIFIYVRIPQKIVVIQFLDHLIADISSRFNDHSNMAASLEKILPVRTDENSSLSSIQ